MLYRKIEKEIRSILSADSNKVLLVQGARQVGKSFIIRHVGAELFKNFIEINLVEDKQGDQVMQGVHTVDDFYFRLSMTYGNKMTGTRKNTLIFLDEIQEYPHLLTLLKFLNADGRFRIVASGSLLGVALNTTISIPIGSIQLLNMHPLDFGEFLRANSIGEYAVESIKERLKSNVSLDEFTHNKLLDLWKKYLIVGGMPDAVNEYLATKNVTKVRDIQRDIVTLYGADASKYDKEHRLVIKRVYDLLPSNMENKKKRIIAKSIEDKVGSRFANYMEEFEYLISSGIALEVSAISNPHYPLAESVRKNLIKLYLNDPGLLTSILYGNDSQAILDDDNSVNLGSVYESAVASQLIANGHKLYYYDNKKKGEVDFLINDTNTHSILPIEVKSGKDYKVHSAISNLLANSDYGIEEGLVLSNGREIEIKDKIRYLPIYYSFII